MLHVRTNFSLCAFHREDELHVLSMTESFLLLVDEGHSRAPAEEMANLFFLLIV